jgi:hypothetical protein
MKPIYNSLSALVAPLISSKVVGQFTATADTAPNLNFADSGPTIWLPQGLTQLEYARKNAYQFIIKLRFPMYIVDQPRSFAQNDGANSLQNREKLEQAQQDTLLKCSLIFSTIYSAWLKSSDGPKGPAQAYLLPDDVPVAVDVCNEFLGLLWGYRYELTAYINPNVNECTYEKITDHIFELCPTATFDLS